MNTTMETPSRSYFKARAREIYYHTSYMIMKHWRLRWLTTRTKELIEAADGILQDDCSAARALLDVALINARKSVAQHGYQKENAA